MMMAAPWLAFMLLAFLVPALIALWILRLRRARVRVPAQWLWAEAREDLRAEVPFQKLRWSVLLLLQCIALALLILAAARPRVAMDMGRGGRTVLLVDTSASMRTRDGPQGQARFELALDAARAAVDRLHPGGMLAPGGGQTMVVALGVQPRIVQPFTDARAVLLRALNQLQVSDEPATIGEAIDLAGAWAAVPDPDAAEDAPPPPPARIEVFSDGRLRDLSEAVEGLDLPLVLHSVGDAATTNRAVAMVGGTRLPEDPDKVRPWASVMHWGPESVGVDVRLSVDGTATAVRRLELPAAEDSAPGRVDVLFPALRISGEVLLQADVLPHDLLPDDDSAAAIVPAATGGVVTLLGDPDVVLVRALLALGLDTESTADGDLVVAVLDEPSTLPSLPSLSFGSPPASSMVRAAGSLLPATIATSDPRHPVSRGSQLSGVRADRIVPLAVEPGVRVLAETTIGAVIVAWREDGVPRVHVGFRPERSTWPLTEDFVTFLVDATSWLVGLADASRVVTAGDMLELALPADAVNVQVHFGGDIVAQLQPEDPSRTVWGPVTQAGIHEVHWTTKGDRHHRRIAVGMPVLLEGDVRLRDAAAQATGIEQHDATRRSMPLWPFAVSMAVLTLVLEWWIWVRRQ
jgi:hypothetical protein